MPSSAVMGKYKSHQLHSGGPAGPVVKSKEQAIAIMFSERRAEAANDGSYSERGKKPKRTKR